MQILAPKGIHRSKHYVPGLKAGNVITTAGIVPLLEDDSVFAPDDPGAQTRFIVEVLEKILAEGGASLKDVTYIHTYHTSGDDMPAIFAALHEKFGEHLPPHTGSGVAKESFSAKGICLEIEFLAVIED